MKKISILATLALALGFTAGCDDLVDDNGVVRNTDDQIVVIEDEQGEEEADESRMSIVDPSVKDDHRDPAGPNELENLPPPPTEGKCKSGATEWTCDPRFCVEWQCIGGKWQWTCQCDANGACWANGGGAC